MSKQALADAYFAAEAAFEDWQKAHKAAHGFRHVSGAGFTGVPEDLQALHKAKTDAYWACLYADFSPYGFAAPAAWPQLLEVRG